MKKIVTYSIAILVCIAFCILFSHVGVKHGGSRNVNPWDLSIGILAIAAIMALVHKIESKRHQQEHHDTHQQ